MKNALTLSFIIINAVYGCLAQSSLFYSNFNSKIKDPVTRVNAMTRSLPGSSQYFRWDTLTSSWSYQNTNWYTYDQFGRNTEILTKDTTGAKWINYKHIFGYDSLDRQIFSLGQGFDTLSQTYYDSFKLEVVYDSNGNQLSFIYYDWDSTTVSWTYYDGYKNELSYDSFNNLICIKEKTFIAGAWRYRNLDSLSYGPNNELILFKHYHNTTTLGIIWKLEYRKTNYLYTAPNFKKPFRYDEEKRTNNSWVPYERDSLFYKSGQLSGILKRYWSNQQTQYVDINLDEFPKDSCGNPNYFRNSNWDPTLGSWRVNYDTKCIKTFINSDCTLAEIYFSSKRYNTQYLNSDRYLYFDFQAPLKTTESFSEDEIIFYPNPGNRIISIKGEIEIKSITIRNNYGKNVASFLLNQDKKIDVSTLLPGIYFMELITTEGLIRKKFIKISD